MMSSHAAFVCINFHFPLSPDIPSLFSFVTSSNASSSSVSRLSQRLSSAKQSKQNNKFMKCSDRIQ